MLPCNSTSKNYILIIVCKYNNYDRKMLLDSSVQVSTTQLETAMNDKCSAKTVGIPNFFPTIFITG